MTDIEVAMLRAENDRLKRIHNRLVLRHQEQTDMHWQTVRAARELLKLLNEGLPLDALRGTIDKLAEFVPEPLERL